MKTALFFFSENNLSAAHQPVRISAEHYGYIRAVAVVGDPQEMLAKAEPMIGETILNAVALEDSTIAYQLLLAAAKEFVEKVESGKARSTQSYARFKSAIAIAEGEGGKK